MHTQKRYALSQKGKAHGPKQGDNRQADTRETRETRYREIRADKEDMPKHKYTYKYEAHVKSLFA